MKKVTNSCLGNQTEWWSTDQLTTIEEKVTFLEPRYQEWPRNQESTPANFGLPKEIVITSTADEKSNLRYSENNKPEKSVLNEKIAATGRFDA